MFFKIETWHVEIRHEIRRNADGHDKGKLAPFAITGVRPAFGSTLNPLLPASRKNTLRHAEDTLHAKWREAKQLVVGIDRQNQTRI
jgi:hypothetical protein